MSLQPTHVEKIRSLLFHPNVNTVKSGLALLVALCPDEEDLQQVFGYSVDCSTFADFHAAVEAWFVQKDTQQYSLQAALCAVVQLAEMQVSWAQRLKKINLKNQKISQLPVSLGVLHQLEYLDLSHTSLTSLPATVGELTALRCLDLQQSLITELPAFLGDLQQLSFLNVNGCGITMLPASFGNLTSLVSLELGAAYGFDSCPKNQLKDLPPSFANLTQLESLDLQENLFTELPVCIGGLVSLRVLDLSYNRHLTMLPESLGKLVELREICLYGTKVTYLPASFEYMDGLEAVDIGAHQLRLAHALNALQAERTCLIAQINTLSNSRMNCFRAVKLKKSKLAMYKKAVGSIVTMDDFLCASTSNKIVQRTGRYSSDSDVIFYIVSKTGKKLGDSVSFMETVWVDRTRFYGFQYQTEIGEQKKFYVQSALDNVVFVPPTKFRVLDVEEQIENPSGRMRDQTTKTTIYLSEVLGVEE